LEHSEHYPWDQPEFSKTARFFELLREGRLATTVCSRCGHVIWPPSSICSVCLSDKMEWVDLPKKGKILELTESFFSIDPKEKTPFAVGAIELTNGARMLARVVGSNLKAGETVHLRRCGVVDDLPFWEFENTRPI